MNNKEKLISKKLKKDNLIRLYRERNVINGKIKAIESELGINNERD